MRSPRTVLGWTSLALAFTCVRCAFPDAAASAELSRPSFRDQRILQVEVGRVDDSLFARIVTVAKKRNLASLSIGERVVAVGKLMLGNPYIAGTLDTDSVHEHLIVNLHGFDCVTFYENALAIARTIRIHPRPTIAQFEQQLTLIRYRDGILDGYRSRLHYSIDYFRNNASKGILRDVTRVVGADAAVLDTLPVNFMTHHRDSYPQLRSDDSEFYAIVNIEKSIREAGGFYYIPKSHIAEIESNIHPGDIVGITTNIPGLDCSHTGIAVRGRDGRIHFMHASSLMHRVIISEEPLDEYLAHNPHQTGIIVNRPLEVTKRTS